MSISQDSSRDQQQQQEEEMSKTSINILSPSRFSQLIKTATSKVVPIDGSWYMPHMSRDPKEEFSKARLPNARFFDVDGISDKDSKYPHMLPTLGYFNQSMSQLGLNKDDHVVIYDGFGNFSAPRVAWTFQVMGHKNVHLLDNFPLYEKEGLPIETGAPANFPKTEYESTKMDDDAVISFDEYFKLLNDKEELSKCVLLDARSLDRFSGAAPEPRPGLPSGHAPGAKSLAFTNVINPETKTFKTKEELLEVFKQVGITGDKRVIVSCGTGVTACILKLALDIAGITDLAGVKVYDGSWTEYASRVSPDMIAKGEN